MSVVLSNSSKGAWMRIDANTTVQLTTIQQAGENVASMGIKRVVWSQANNMTLARGSNVILTLVGNGDQDYTVMGQLVESPAANVVITLNGIGTALVQFSKVLQ